MAITIFSCRERDSRFWENPKRQEPKVQRYADRVQCFKNIAAKIEKTQQLVIAWAVACDGIYILHTRSRSRKLWNKKIPVCRNFRPVEFLTRENV